MRACPRVHLKMIAADGEKLYLGSANFTGAGPGEKSDGRRNVELGIVTMCIGGGQALAAMFRRI